MNVGAFSGWQLTLTISKIGLCEIYAVLAIAMLVAVAIWRSAKEEKHR